MRVRVCVRVCVRVSVRARGQGKELASLLVSSLSENGSMFCGATPSCPVRLVTCNINQWSMDIEGNLEVRMRTYSA